MPIRKICPSLLLFFSEPTNAQHYVQISYTDSHPNWTLNVEITDWNAFTPPGEVGLSLWQLHYTHYYSFNSKSDIKVEKCGENLFTLLSKVFTAPIFTEVTNAERHCVKTCYKFYPYQSSNMESKSAPLYRHWGSVQAVRPIAGVEV